MICNQCKKEFKEEDIMKWKSKNLCEDCYVDLLTSKPDENNWKTLKDQHGKPDL